MKSPCDDCKRCNTTHWKCCTIYQEWFQRVWSKLNAEEVIRREKYREHLRQMYREATFLTEEEQRERDRKNENTVTATHRWRSVCG